MVLPINFKGTSLDVIQKLTEKTDTSKPNPDIINELYDPENYSEFAFALTIGVMYETLTSLYRIQYGKEMTMEEHKELSQIIAYNTSKLREYFEVGHLK